MGMAGASEQSAWSVGGRRFAIGRPLLLRRTDTDWTVYSVGPDSEDDGGPVRANVENPGGNDDIGVPMKL